MKYLYAFFDGDNIGEKLEIMLTENRITEAQELSEKIKASFETISELLIKEDKVEILILGGDDLLIKVYKDDFNLDLIEMIRKIFNEMTTLTMSCGIGLSSEKAVRNLYLAKLYGKNQIKM